MTSLAAESFLRLQRFCKSKVPDFSPLGGNRPEAAVAACAAISLYTSGLLDDVIVAPDVLDTALAALCAPYIVTNTGDLQGREVLFRCPAVAVRLRTTDSHTLERLHKISAGTNRLTVVVQLDDSVTVLPDDFMTMWRSVAQIDLRRTQVERIGAQFLFGCPNLTSVELPQSLTEVGPLFLNGCSKLRYLDFRRTSVKRIAARCLYRCANLTTVDMPESLSELGYLFLAECEKLQFVDLQRTALHVLGAQFAADCPRLATVMLPDTITEIGDDFLSGCDSVDIVGAFYHHNLGRRRRT